MAVVTQIVKKRREKKKKKKKEKKDRTKKEKYSNLLNKRAVSARVRSRHCPVNENEWATATT
jgi:hypothetical protein